VSPIAERPQMPEYDVPEDLDGVLPWSWAEERLAGSRNYWVTTATPTGRPHSMPVWGAWLPALDRFWFSCATSSRKARNARANPQVVVAPTDTVEVVSLEGTAVEVTGTDISDRIDAYFAKYGEEMAMTREAVGAFILGNASFDVLPERAFGMIERPEDFSRRATRWRW
jgi:hypothetical protein